MSVNLDGLDELKQWMAVTAPELSRKLAGDMVMDVAERIAEEAKARMPVDTGLMKKSTKAVRGKAERGKASAGVTVRGPKASASHPYGYAFYWYILEHGNGPDGIEYAMFSKAQHKVETTMESTDFSRFKRRLAGAFNK